MLRGYLYSCNKDEIVYKQDTQTQVCQHLNNKHIKLCCYEKNINNVNGKL